MLLPDGPVNGKDTMITSARNNTLDDARESANLGGEPVSFVALDGHLEPTVWLMLPDVAEPQPVLRRVTLPAAHREAAWQALTAHLPVVSYE